AAAGRFAAAAARRADPDEHQRAGAHGGGRADGQARSRRPRGDARSAHGRRAAARRDPRARRGPARGARSLGSVAAGIMRPVQKYVVSELDSGERVISERIPSVRSVAIGFWIGAGSRDETDAKAGVSHFIEHLLFKGSQRHTAQEIAEIFDGLGGELNAATSREHPMVYARVPADPPPQALHATGATVLAPTFRGLDAARGVRVAV